LVFACLSIRGEGLNFTFSHSRIMVRRGLSIDQYRMPRTNFATLDLRI
jgi:hypothetical protein